MTTTVHVIRPRAVSAALAVQRIDHPPYVRVVILPDGTEDRDGGIAIVEDDPAALADLASAIRCSTAMAAYLREGGSVEHWHLSRGPIREGDQADRGSADRASRSLGISPRAPGGR